MRDNILCIFKKLKKLFGSCNENHEIGEVFIKDNVLYIVDDEKGVVPFLDPRTRKPLDIEKIKRSMRKKTKKVWVDERNFAKKENNREKASEHER